MNKAPTKHREVRQQLKDQLEALSATYQQIAKQLDSDDVQFFEAELVQHEASVATIGVAFRYWRAGDYDAALEHLEMIDG